MTATEVRDAIIAKLNVAPATASANAYTQDALKALATKPEAYTEVMVMERPTEGARAGGLSPSTAWRVITRAVGKDEVRAEMMRARARARLLEATITVSSVESTLITSPVADNPIAEDSDWFSGAAEWSFYL